MSRFQTLVAAIAGSCYVLLQGCVAVRAEALVLPELPAAIQPSDLKPYLAAFANGVQIYSCKHAETGAWNWSFKAPEAELFDNRGTKLGRHYAGPTWEGQDGGKVSGALKASANAPTQGAVPWLLIDVKSREGSGAFTAAKSILRVSTVGGVAPVAGCDEAHAGSEARVSYTATYFFLR